MWRYVARRMSVIPEDLPYEISFDEIELFDDIDIRVSSIGCLFANIIGVNENYVEFCPNETPASREEYLGWVWLIKPSLGHEIAINCSDELAKLISHYQSGKMDKWFE